MARLTHLNRNSPVRGANSAGSQGTRRASLVAPPPPPRAAALARSVGAPSPQATKRVLHRIRDQCGAETMPIKTLPRCDAPPSGHCTRRPPEPGAHHPDEEQCTESRTVTGGTMHAAIQGLPTQRHPFHAPAQSPPASHPICDPANPRPKVQGIHTSPVGFPPSSATSWPSTSCSGPHRRTAARDRAFPVTALPLPSRQCNSSDPPPIVPV